MLLENAQHQKIHFSNYTLSIDTLFLKVDFKDIEFLHELLLRSRQELQRHLASTAEAMEAEEVVAETKVGEDLERGAVDDLEGRIQTGAEKPKAA